MSSDYVHRSIWSTIGYAITDTGDENVSTREEIASILVDALNSIGAAEFEYSYTGIATEAPFPEAFVFDEDGQTLRMILIAGMPSTDIPRKIEEEFVRGRITDLISNLEGVYAADEKYPDTGVDALGEFVYLLRTNGNSIKSVRLTVVALGNCEKIEEIKKLPTKLKLSSAGSALVIDMFDISKLQKAIDSASTSGSVEINFRDYMGSPLKCLQAPRTEADFETYLAIIPGNTVAAIYERFQTQVLQRNVRNFLQATGKVNKGIQKSLREKPEKFLAFNNGLTITASSVELNESNQIEVLRDFQIVNGGQTTASLDFARRYSGLDLDSVSIQAKIVVIDIKSDPTFIDDVSNFANSQNKVKTSDFASRDEFHITLEKLMRDEEELIFEWADGKKSCWFYEAFRGGYATEVGQRRGRKKDNFKLIYPKSQVINKLELAKCENGWDGYPYQVCKGDDMNFAAWIKRTKPHSRPTPDILYCKELIAKVMLWRTAIRLPKEENFSGYRSQISAMSFSYLMHLLERKNLEIDLECLWDSGCVPLEIENEMRKIVHFVKEFLPRRTEEANLAQWAKKPNSWELLKVEKNSDAAKAIARLQKAGLTREKTADYDLLVSRSVEILEKLKKPLNRSELLEQLNLDLSHWDKFRKELLSSGEVMQTGTGPGSKYGIGP